MKQESTVLAAVVLLVAGWATAQEGDVPFPKQPFSAEFVYTMNGEPMPGMSPIKVAATTEALRVDFSSHVAIVEKRTAGAQVTTLLAGEKSYTVQNMADDSEDLGAYFFMMAPPKGFAEACAEDGLECRMLGVEEVGGRRAEHWRINDPEEGEGDTWVDVALGIVLKSTGEEGYGLLARNLSTGSPGGSLFDVPEGYTKAGGEGW